MLFDFQKVVQLVSDDLQKVEQEIERNLSSEVDLLSTINNYIGNSGGKRIRPILLLLCCKLCDYTGPRSIIISTTVEFFHTASLLHDDVLDGAETRRGKDSTNFKWGNEAAVLAGDFLFSKAFQLMSEDNDSHVMKTLIQATLKMVEGEVMQLKWSKNMDISEKIYFEIINRKTARLIAASCQAGAIIGKASLEKEKALANFGANVGMAFQTIDDTLDFLAQENKFGKTIGKDLCEGNITLPLIHTLQNCNQNDRTQLKKLVNSNTISDADVDEIRTLISRHNGFDYARGIAQNYINQAKQNLHVFEDSDIRQLLLSTADYVIERDK